MFKHQDQDEDYIHPLALARYINRKPVQWSRREILRWGGLGMAMLLGGCSENVFTAENSDDGTTDTAGDGSCTVIPTETEGPYPASSVLTNSSIYRSNIVDGRTGAPLNLTLNLQDVNNSCAALENAAIYIWHCDAAGSYSGYSSSQNGSYAGYSFLRGVQVTDAQGQVSFTTIYPGWYSGRITHVHFEVFLDNNLNSSPVKISQIAFPQSVTQTVYNSTYYSSHGQNTSVTSFSQDNVFSDGTTYQMATVSGSVSQGYSAVLNIGVSA
ncbi:MAG: intradiol ring-cleavage dioxygenase [Bdellovibrio sp.]